LGLGISGGLLPCPSALVLLLAAVAVNRTALGIALVAAFSLGLAGVLTAIGLLFVKGGKLIARIPHGAPALRFLPIASALFIVVVGVWLTVGAIMTIRL
jgi:ABC-type nickel/cobalt efflux system permease component RcnA